MRVYFSILLMLAFIVNPGTADKTYDFPYPEEKNLTVGALLPLHGDSDNHGISAKIALSIAENDINDLFISINRSFRVHVIVEDTQTSPDVTFEALKKLQSQGIKIIVGPEDSQSLAKIREYANRSGIILISCSSTASSLAIENDTTFRLVPSDVTLAHLMAYLIKKDGIKVIIPLARNDIWADGMINATRSEFEDEDRIMLDGVRYDPHTLNFSQDLISLSSEVKHAVDGNGAGQVAVYVSAFDEIVPILSQAYGDPQLSSVRWYGNDLSAVAVRMDRNASEFAFLTQFLSPVYGGIGGPKYEQIKNAVFEETGREGSSLVANDYDALWLITYTYLLAGSDDPNDFKTLFPIVASKYRGEFGWMRLNKAGDLDFVPFTLANLVKDNETFKWVSYAIL